MAWWPFRRRVEVRTETVHVPCVPPVIEIKHTHDRRNERRPVAAYIETHSEWGMPMRGSRVELNCDGRLSTEVLIPKDGGGYERHFVSLVVEFGYGS